MGINNNYILIVVVLLLCIKIPILNAQINYTYWKTFTSEKCKMNIDFPHNFTVKENTDLFEDGIEFYLLSDNPYIRVLVDCNKLEGGTPENYFHNISEVKDKLMSHDTFIINEINTTKWKIGGLDTVSFTYASGEAAHTGAVTSNEVFYINNSDQTILIRFITLFSDFESHYTQTIQRDIMNSIEFYD